MSTEAAYGAAMERLASVLKDYPQINDPGDFATPFLLDLIMIGREDMARRFLDGLFPPIVVENGTIHEARLSNADLTRGAMEASWSGDYETLAGELEKKLRAVREVLGPLLDDSFAVHEEADGTRITTCLFCQHSALEGRELQHKSDCPVLRADELMGRTP